MKVYRDISNRPINEIDTYPWIAISAYDLVILRDQAALGRVDGPDLSEPIKKLREAGTKVLLWTNFGELNDGDPESDWRYKVDLLKQENLIAKTARGKDAVRWNDPRTGKLGYHVDPHKVRPETYGPWLASHAKSVGADGLLLDFIDPLSKPWTPPPFEAPAFAATKKGLDAFDNYRLLTLRWLINREDLLVYANGRGPQIDYIWWKQGLHGAYWEQFGDMWDGPEGAVIRMDELTDRPGRHLLDGSKRPDLALACSLLLPRVSVVEDYS